ncbi:PA0069 family radical SAM protein [Comamonas sp. CMM01]|uniref:PA0069 family radical SAM protein n=1 Tax=Comamonas sp. CMM01 TaxID=2769280 RepID=UPI0017867FD0|nr:PA0069 family radical SAM protein [Comamonas sp. CMM01]MBD9534147.1 PA0069 family radical SAM protein [Comamonas sp. CMM01]
MSSYRDQHSDLPAQPVPQHKGRGAASWIAHRFARDAREAFDDGWADPAVNAAGAEGDDGEAATALRTQLEWEQCKSALSRHDSPDLPFHLGLNPYRGCEHGCIYCYARPTHSYLGYSPGLDFETRLVAKANLPEVLGAELSRPRHVAAPVMLGSVTDCYQPIERDVGLTRRTIEVLAAARHPFSIVTKGSGIERDLDLLVPLARQNLVAVYVTLTTLQPDLARRLEPRAAAPHRRLRTVRALAEAGVPVGVSLAPQIPFLNDDLEQVLAAAQAAGARQAFYAVLRLPWELAPLFEEWLRLHYPDRAQRVLERVRDLHGISEEGRAEGKVYQSQFGQRMKGTGAWADMLAQRFSLACRKLGLNRERVQLDCSQYHPSLLGGQQSLF